MRNSSEKHTRSQNTARTAVVKNVLNEKGNRLKKEAPLSPAEKRVRTARRWVLLILSGPVVLSIAQALVPADQWIMYRAIRTADPEFLVKGFNEKSQKLSKKYPEKIALVLTKDGSHEYHDTTISIPVKGALHTGATHLNCSAIDYTDHMKRLKSIPDFRCQLGEDMNPIPGGE